MSENLIVFGIFAFAFNGGYGVWLLYMKFGIDLDKFSYLMKLQGENIYAYIMALLIILIFVMLLVTPAYILITVTGIIGKSIEHFIRMIYHFLRHMINGEKTS